MAVKYYVKKDKLCYKNKISVEPNIHTYTSKYTENHNNISYKYSCPICDSLKQHHQIPENADHCPICGIYFNWKYINNDKELEENESLYVG